MCTGGKEENLWQEDLAWMLNAQDISQDLGVSKSKAYAIIRKLNEELQSAGYLIISGKVPRDYYRKRFNIAS